MGYERCGRKSHQHGGPCKLPAGWGTDHNGDGACSFHGGKSPRGPASQSYKHGLYSKYRSPEETARFEEWKERGGITAEELPIEIEWAVFKLLDAVAVQTKHSPTTLADVLDKLLNVMLKAQKYRGAEKPSEVNVSFREELLSRLRSIAERSGVGDAAGGPDGGAGG